MYSAIFDSNVLRGLGSAKFEEVLAAEASAGVLPLADSWTLFELLAHLVDPTRPSYWPCRRAIQRSASRSLRHDPPRLLWPAEAQVARLLFDADPPGVAATLSELAATCAVVAEADDADDLTRASSTIATIAAHVAAQEAWFAAYLSDLTAKVLAIEVQPGEDSAAKQARAFLQSAEMARFDAIAITRRAYTQMGISIPDPIPEAQLDRVAAACRAGTMATSLVLESAICDGVNVDSPRIRNLLWDQEIAFSVGQTIQDLPVVLVTGDGLFHRAGKAVGLANQVFTADEYVSTLGIVDAV